MAKAFVPKANSKTMDLGLYGGSGKFKVNALTGKTSAMLTERLQEMAIRDGYSLNDISSKVDEINAKYTIPTILLAVELCVEVEDDEGYRPITKDEVESLPMRLCNDVYYLIMEMNDFPLVQNAGEESN